MGRAGHESAKGRTLKAYDRGDKCEVQGLRAPRGEHLRPITPVGWQSTARVAGTHAKRRV